MSVRGRKPKKGSLGTSFIIDWFRILWIWIYW